MYETTISVPKSDKHILEYIKSQMASAVTEIDGIATDVEDKRRCYYALACSDTFRFQLKRLLSESVSSAVALGYKNIFVRKCLKVSQCDFFQNVLINTMCVFDKSYDQQIITKILDVDKPMYIDGYYNFKMSLLKRKWKEIAKLVSDNNFILQDRQLILEFLQYLLESITCKVSHLTLTLEDNSFLEYDSHNDILPNVQSLAPSPTVEEEAAINVLLLKPKRLTVFGKKHPSEDFCTLMRLFDCEFQNVE